ncbi:MAG: hypothetical protein RR604_08540, partial [Eubacterium sp.]
MINVNLEMLEALSVKGVKDLIQGVEPEFFPELCVILEQDKRSAVKNLARTLLNQYKKRQGV